MKFRLSLPRGSVDLLKELLFPQGPGCPLCDRAGSARHICRSCLATWSDQTLEMEICKLCGRFGMNLGPDRVCQECREEAPSFVFARGVAPYEGPVQDALSRYKFAGLRELARPLGEVMAAMTVSLIPYRDLAGVVPVPLHPNRERQRRFDQAALLASEVARLSRLPLIAGALARLRDTPSQTALSRSNRRLNVAGAFQSGAAVAGLKGKDLLLVDDVFTTGATTGECARTLLAAGVARVYVATLATSMIRDQVGHESTESSDNQESPILS